MRATKISKGRLAFYARFSSDNQREESIDAQIRIMEDYAKRTGPWEVIEPYVDRAKSATTDKRPAFQQMIQDAEDGKFDAILVHKLDRFARDKYSSAVYKHRLKKCGVQLISVTENLDGSPESVMLESVLEGMAQYYSANLSREVMKGLMENALSAKHTGGKPALGYDVGNDGKYIINEKEATIIRTIFELYLEGKGYGQILHVLHEKGWKTKTGRAFSKSALYHLLRNESYKGVYTFNKDKSRNKFSNTVRTTETDELVRIEDGMPAIVSKADFDEVQKLLSYNKLSGGAQKAKEPYLLTGIAVCGECGSPMQGNSRTGGNTTKMYRSYRCGCKVNKKLCKNKEIRKNLIEDFVLDQLERVVLNERIVLEMVKALNEKISDTKKSSKAEIKEVEKKLRKVGEQIDKIVEIIMEGVSVGSFKDKLTKLENEKEELQSRHARLNEINTNEQIKEVTEQEVMELIKKVKEYVLTRNLPQCKKFIRDYVKQVKVYESHIEVIFNVAFSMGRYIEFNRIIKISRLGLYDEYRLPVVI